MKKPELKKLSKFTAELSNLPPEERVVKIREAKKANLFIDVRLENYRERFKELNGRYPEQKEIPKILGGTMA